MLNLDRSTWKTHRFGDLVRNSNESVKDVADSGIEHLIALEHLDPGEITLSRYGKVVDGTTFTRRVRPGQTLFGKRRAYQRKAAYAEVDAICSGDILVFEAVPDRMSPRLLPFLVHSDAFFDHALGTSAGSLSPRTSWRALADFEVALPRLDEQERIADLLWAIQEHWRALGKLASELAATRDCAIEEWLSRIGGNGAPLETVAAVTSGITLGPKRKAFADVAPYLRVANVHRDSLNLAEIKEVGVTEIEARDKRVCRGDILMVEGHATAGEVGRAAIWERDEEPLFQNHLFRIRAGDGIEPRFLLEALNSTSARAYIRLFAKSTSGLNTINSQVVKSIPVPRVDRTSQVEIVRWVQTLDRSRAAGEANRASCRLLFRRIVSAVFGGST